MSTQDFISQFENQMSPLDGLYDKISDDPLGAVLAARTLDDPVDRAIAYQMVMDQYNDYCGDDEPSHIQ